MIGHRRNDSGAALVVALAFVTVISIGTTALITLADTGQRTSRAVRVQGHEVYAASGAVDRAIDDVRQNVALGRQAGPCPDTTTVLNGVSTKVTCSGAAGSGGSSGGGANSNNTPPNAILTLATSEVGLRQESNNDLKITGPVLSNSTVQVDVSSSSLTVDGAVKARGACSAQVSSTPAPACNLGAATIDDSADPGYLMHPDATAGSPPVPAPAPQGCTGGTPKLVVFEPGTYNSVTALNNVFTTCSGSVFWFKSGFYYFDFTDSTAAWQITGSQTHVVGGERTRWIPSSPDAGDPAPVVPFPAKAIPAVPPLPEVPEVLGGCVTSEEVATTPGVQWAFGGTSRVIIQDAKVELCARGSSTEQQIAFYGLPPAQDTTSPAPGPQTVTYAFAGPATSTTTPAFTDADNAREAGSGVAKAVATDGGSGSTATLLVPGLAGPAVPAGATVTAVRLRLIHQPLNANVTDLGARLLRSNGTVLATLAAVNGNNCSASTTSGICAKESATAYEQLIDLPTTMPVADLANARLEFNAKIKTSNNSNPGEQQVDAVTVEVTYTPQAAVPYRMLTGCAATAGGCSILQTSGNPTKLSLHGTLYAPTAAVQIELPNNSTQVLERGVIARTLRVSIPTNTFTGSPIQLPTLSSTPGNRKVIFLARQANRLVLRAVVRFDDNALLSPDKRADVLSWSVLR